ncbi:MAG: DEAD/DEAH box helicase family protein [Armatimonadetes bacterium]|nr:DEAD/DEAH box helicase family protein [Armatimonadota bacterium]
MELKKFQVGVLDDVRAFLQALAEEQAKGNPRYASQEAWERVGLRSYHQRRTGDNRDLPTFCIKVPTGGGKTLLATQILGEAYRTILSGRNGAGLVLWVVPSDQIYKDTLKALRDRTHFYRQSLEYALSRRVEVWEKHEIARLTPAQLASCLNVLIVKLQGTNRQDRESLKFFQDSGGNIVQHFPAEDDSEAHRGLKQRVPNLDMLVEEPATGTYLARTSIANLVRLCEPAVVLDEGHKATSTLARQTIEGFNPRLVVELSATPQREANVLTRVTGLQLLDEEMIKLPINVVNSRQTSWQYCLTQARDRREELAGRALEFYRTTGRLIRPMVLVQVERTGKDQRTPEFIHSEQVREYLIQRLGVPAESVKVKTSERDDIEGIDLLAEDCRVEWIITKSALQEGWDCPFAYVLVSLSNTKSRLAMTQLVGRVLRQPFVTKTPFQELNESYVYCLRQHAAEVVDDIRRALLKEGYEGDMASVVDRTGDADTGPATRVATMRFEFRRHYRKPFEGRIFLPRFCVQTDDGYEPLDYFRHLLKEVHISRFDYEKASEWNFSPDIESAKEQFYRVHLNEEALAPLDIRDVAIDPGDTEARVKAWLVANLAGQMEWYSAKRLRAVVEGVCAALHGVNGKMALVRFRLLERIAAFTEEQTDRQTWEAFRQLHDSGRVFFYLGCLECVYEIPPKVVRRRIKPLQRPDYTPVQKNLFDFHPDEDNEYEKSVALYLDEHPQVLWWYRNIVGHDQFNIQGWRRPRIYPDFVVQQGTDGKPSPSVWVIESKGKHLKGSLDTEYKRDIARYFSEEGRQVTWQELGEGFDEHCFRFQVLDQGDYGDADWRDELNKMLFGC